MALNKALCWYQQKIGAYDKQLWEETIEQRILSGLSHVPKKSGKLKLEYIDLDLVRGSSFPKLKPKHGFVTIARLGIIRLLLLPFYRHWWIRQTSYGIFNILLLLYGFQIFNMAVYLTWSTSGMSPFLESTLNITVSESSDGTAIDVTSEEVLVPGIMMCILSLLLSQMVSIHTNTSRSLRRPKNKVRIKRIKRRLGHNRRISMAASDSKSSLDNLEQQSDRNLDCPPDQPMKKRSSSEERPPSRIKVTQRSSSLQLEAVKDIEPQQPNIISARKASWFFAWPVRLVVPSRGPNEDEGFDSFHGNNSSSSDCDNEDKLEINDKEKDVESKADRVVNSTEAIERSEPVIEPTSDLDAQLGSRIQDLKENNSSVPMLRRRRNLPSIALNLIPPPLSTNDEPYSVQSESEYERPLRKSSDKCVTILSSQRRRTHSTAAGESSYQSSCESDGDIQSTVTSPCYKLSEPSTPLDWTGVTTNSEECSYSSESGSESDSNEATHFSGVGDIWNDELAFGWEIHGTPTISANCSASDKVSCTIWEGSEVKKADLSVLDVAAAIIAKVAVVPESTDYLCGGLVMAAVFALLPIVYRVNGSVRAAACELVHPSSMEKVWLNTNLICDTLLGASVWEKFIVLTAAVERFAMASFFLFLLAVAERTFKQRFLYAKLFSHLTSSRRARNSDLPHFRLNKVRNIKTWLSVRSYLKKRGPQRSVDCIVSAAFIITLLLVSFLCMELLKESQYLHQSLYNLEVLCWCLVLGVFLLRFMTLGSKINKKYRNLSVLITEQINLYLQMEQKPNKKEELMLANNVLKLAADLLKELESPFKISGLSANPYLYNLTKVVVLSAVSGVLSEMLGFKLKLHKIKIR